MVGIPVDYFVIYCNTGMLPYEFWKASREGELQYKPADKSPEKSTASPPEKPGISPSRQMIMDFVKNLRRMDGDG